MTVWHIVLISAIAVLALKLSGYLVPPSVLEKPTVSRTSSLLTVALLAALVGVQTFTTGSAIVLDARVPAIGVAAVLLALRAPFIVVVVAAAATAALLRMWWP
ncbi:branched-subunit amino acid transport protein AzlD [Diaminobutyricimonas aerilata]|uniref:Branched-subunit amino acid transport protein AzlD n=1 Tax=Diaminobutyricimonas aerilata TaxID=1162967 RepID=A0A2M9CJI0_9MICO|nr:AzlD domain-containing protein [Diaminobutyricimonas aerilata]PJJ72059.1 branched-subunit amino acid transport protein AzlD [Diaminobutyricimonas aerilata]